MKTINAINRLKKVSLVALLTFTFSLSTLFAQNDTMYVMKNGAVVGQYNVNTEVDSVIFYSPTNTYTPDTVINPTTGETWMDRNLGATQVATSSTDADAYGDLYQWGRSADGHESRTSGITATLATSDAPGHSDFIKNGSNSYDWRNPQNDNLWQGVSGTNNPCPRGYRLPTEAEWDAERTSWSSNNAAGAFASPLKLPVAGSRSFSNGSISNEGSTGGYWSSSVLGGFARFLDFGSSNASMISGSRAYGFSIRCLKE